MADKIKVGIIGCGGIANGKHLPALRAIADQVELVAFCDIVVERAEKAKADFGTPDSKVYENYKDLLADKSIVAVHVCTPNRMHSPISVDALDAGKHVICEKPMAINSAEAKKMLDAAKRNGKILTIGYQNRQTPAARFLRDEAQEGVFGDIYFAKATAIRRRGVPTWGVFLNEYEQGGGPLIDIGTHSLDLTLWVMNNYKPKYCVGTAYHELNNLPGDKQGNSWGNWSPEKFTVEDAAFGFVVMENGATIILESSWALNIIESREATTLVCGTKAGGDMYDQARINGVENGRKFVTKYEMNGGGAAFFDSIGDDPANVREAKLFYKAVREGTEPFVKAEEAYVVTRILEGIYESAKSGKPYYFENN